MKVNRYLSITYSRVLIFHRFFFQKKKMKKKSSTKIDKKKQIIISKKMMLTPSKSLDRSRAVNYEKRALRASKNTSKQKKTCSNDEI